MNSRTYYRKNQSNRNRIASINPDDPSMNVDELVYDLYEKSITKNGELATFNELQSFIQSLKQEMEEAVADIEESEKWFSKKLEHVIEFSRPYREKPPTDKEKLDQLGEDYPTIDYENFIEEYEWWPSLRLAEMIHFLDENMTYFNGITSVNLGQSATELREDIIQFDTVYLMYHRAIDLKNHMAWQFSSGLKGRKIKFDDFKRTGLKIKTTNSGPTTPPQLLEDINTILEGITKEEDEELYTKEGRLVIKRVIEQRAYGNRMFAKMWVKRDELEQYPDHWDDGKDKNRYGYKRLHDLFSERYREMKENKK